MTFRKMFELSIFFIFYISITLNAATDQPYFIGSLLSPHGKTVAKGKVNWETYLYVTDNIGVYKHFNHHHSAPGPRTVNPVIDVSFGLSSCADLEIIGGFESRKKKGVSSTRMTDTIVKWGYQALVEDNRWWKPDLRITLNQSYPTGIYNKFNPKKLDTESSGTGSFHNGLGLNFQKLYQICGIHYLRVRFALTYTIGTTVHVRGVNTFGGGFGTKGKVKPGDLFTGLLALEYSLTKRTALAIDILQLNHLKSKFSGAKGVNRMGNPAKVGRSNMSQFSLAPAIEYSFSKNFGVIGGVWFTVTGRNSTDFVSGVVATNYFF
jgi:hypothetical protein